MICFSFVWVKVIFSFYHGRKSPLNHQLGKIFHFLFFFQPPEANLRSGLSRLPLFTLPITPTLEVPMIQTAQVGVGIAGREGGGGVFSGKRPAKSEYGTKMYITSGNGQDLFENGLL